MKMKTRFQLLITLVLLTISQVSIGQSKNDVRLKQLPVLIQKAVDGEDFQKAADLKKEEGLRFDMKKALYDEDYAKAAQLSNQIKMTSGEGTSNKITSLEKELDQAINSEDYGRASQIKKQIEALKNGSSSNQTISATQIVSGNILDQLEFINQVYYYDKSEGRAIPLEKGKPEIKSSTKAVPGYAQSTSYYVIDGVRSPVRFSGVAGHSFIVKTTPGVDPSDTFRLVKFEILGRKTPQRHMAAFTATGSGWGWGSGGSSGQISKFDVPIEFKKIENGVYEIILQQSLEKAEYTFYLPNKMYAFGIN